MKVVVLLLGLCCFHQTSGDTHSMKYITTAVTGVSEIPQYTTVGLVDDMPFVYFDSNINRMIPKTKWIEETVGKDYFDSESQREAGIAPVYKANIQTAMERFNQTKSTGVHTFQRMYGCQWDDESEAVDGFNQFGYDGEDFISMDLKNLRWIAPTPQSLITKQKWDNDRALNDNQRNYYSKICIEWLKKYLHYGSSTLERKVRPEVTLLQKDSGVVCHATGFYPDGVMITWKRDGEEMQDDVDVGETLPNEDGTFQKRAVLTVSPEEKETKGRYICEVAHKSGELITVSLDEIKRKNPDSGSVPFGAIFGAIFGVIGLIVVVIIAIGGVIARKKWRKQHGFIPASTGDGSSKSSSNEALIYQHSG